jgi:MFS family permease
MGLKTTGVIATGLLLVGSVIGWFATSAGLMFFTRIIEGAGTCLISIMAPASIAVWFPPEKRGVPMGLWATWVPFGFLLISWIGPRIGATNWQNIWAFTTIITTVSFLLMIALFRMPKEGEVKHSTQVAAGTDTVPAAPGSPYKVMSIWILALCFALFNAATAPVDSFLPNFLEETRGWTKIAANTPTIVYMLVAIACAFFVGKIADVFGSRKKLIYIGTVMTLISVALAFTVNNTAILYIAVILLGASYSFVPTGVLSGTPDIMGPNAEIGMSIVFFGQYIGMFFAPLIFPKLYSVASIGYSGASIMLIILAVLMFPAAYFVKIK